mgnify:FL=1
MSTVSLGERPSISTSLRDATATAHERAERSDFIDDLMAGRLDVRAYSTLAAQLYFVYRALEEVGDDLNAADDTKPVVAPIFDERLRRLPRLAADLDVLGVEISTVEPLPAVTRYVAAIDATRADPARYVAHHYTRYLGDLSGGQVIKSRMISHYGIDKDALTFYAFDGIDKLKRYKDGYRDALDGLPIDEAAHGRLLDEAVRAFEFNEALFAELTA